MRRYLIYIAALVALDCLIGGFVGHSAYEAGANVAQAITLGSLSATGVNLVAVMINVIGMTIDLSRIGKQTEGK